MDIPSVERLSEKNDGQIRHAIHGKIHELSTEPCSILKLPAGTGC